ncbi:MAG: ABC transporter ATP-binding protein, partial [Actinomycetes bacterium]
MLEVKDLAAGYSGSRVLEDISFTATEQGCLAVLGANGVGKTTLLKCLAGTQPLSEGSVRLDGQDISRLSPQQRVARGLVLVPEGHQVFPAMTVEENLWIGSHAGARRQPNAGSTEDFIYELFPRLAERQMQAAGTLSGGERQMLSVSRALLSRPKVLMLDEPSHGLSPGLVGDMANAIREILNYTTVLVVEQNLTVPRACADRVVVIAEGSITAEGPAAELIGSELVASAYLGTTADMRPTNTSRGHG